MKVKALKRFENVIDKEVGRFREEGEIWEVTENRFKVLTNANLVEAVEEVKKEVKTAVKKPKTRKAVKNKID